MRSLISLVSEKFDFTSRTCQASPCRLRMSALATKGLTSNAASNSVSIDGSAMSSWVSLRRGSSTTRRHHDSLRIEFSGTPPNFQTLLHTEQFRFGWGCGACPKAVPNHAQALLSSEPIGFGDGFYHVHSRT